MSNAHGPASTSSAPQPTVGAPSHVHCADPRAIFAWIWVVANLTHVWNQAGSGFLGPEPLSDPWYAAVLVAGTIALLLPERGWALALFAGIQLLACLFQLPVVPDHWMLAALVNAALLYSAARVHRRGGLLTTTAVVDGVAPFIRTALILAYSAAALSKLNHTFLDPEVSCAVTLTTNVLGFWGITVPHAGLAGHLLAAGVAATELLVPLLLLISRARPVGVAVSAMFHFAMASTPALNVMDFTGMMLALLILFVPAGAGQTVSRFGEIFTRTAPSLPRAWTHLGVRLAVLATLALLAGFRGGLVGDPAFLALSYFGFLVFWGAVTALVLGSALAQARRHAAQRGPEPLGLRPSGAVQWALVALLALSCIAPYVGLQTTRSFSMFSNLRTENGISNHLFIGRIGPLDLQDDFVTVLESSNDGLSAAAERGELVHWLEVRRLLSQDPDAAVRLVRGGREIHAVRAADDPRLVSVGAVESKVLRFRNLAIDGNQPCIGR